MKSCPAHVRWILPLVNEGGELAALCQRILTAPGIPAGHELVTFGQVLDSHSGSPMG